MFSNVVLLMLLVFAPVVKPRQNGTAHLKLAAVNAQCKYKCSNLSAIQFVCIEDCVNEFIQLLTRYENKTGVNKSALIGMGPSPPNLVCREETKIVLRWTQQTILGIPIIFIIHVLSTEDNEWHLANMTDQTFETITDLHSGFNYQFRITALTVDGEIGVPSKSDQISTLKDGFIPDAIKNVTVDQSFNDDGDLTAVVAWQPASDKTCYYDVDLLVTAPEGLLIHRRTFIEDPKILFATTFDKLPYYDTTYTVIVRGRTVDKTREGGEYSVTFLTLTCLQANNFNTSLCRPNAPNDLSVQEVELDDASFNVTVKWVSPSTEPTLYSITLKLFGNDSQPTMVSMNVTGNVTKVEFPSVVVNPYYSVEVKGYTSAGYGDAATATRIFVANNTTDVISTTSLSMDSYYNVAFVIVITLLLLTLIVGTSLLIYHQNMKRKRYERRCQYFESLDKKLPIECNLSETSYVDDDWEIPVDKLLLGDILGEGAFGIVRQGLLQARNHGDQPLTEVAVKMLKEDPSLDEIRQFHQEIDMMKSVGHHIHIVSIIGCCTHTHTNSRVHRRLLLVTEYCALGDLQRFLRKKWDKISRLSSKTPVYSDESTAESYTIKYAKLLISSDSNSSSVINLSENNPKLAVNQLYDIDHVIEKKIIKNNFEGCRNIGTFYLKQP